MNGNDKIDQRIVEMSFENEKFEKGISQSKNSLKEFSDILKHTGVSNDFSGLEKSVTSLSGSLSAMEQIGVGALRRIGESAVIAGTQLVKSLTIDRVMDGFNEYELKMNTIRAIMNSTGESAEGVREKLKSLDDYADKTIFSTKDMFDNLATFTNAGISLDKATNAMIGIANATAYAGQDTYAATIAYRNFSDAISNGYMSLMDWRSISRVAKIGTQEFRTEILKTAVEMGTLTQAQIDSGAVTAQFEDTLKDQWLTADVVTAVLNKYGDATTEIGKKAWAAAQEIRTFSGMMESLKASVGTQFANMSELIFGDLEEAKRNFTYLNTILTTIFADGLNNANKMLAGVKELGGISNVFQGLKNIAIAVLSVLKPIAQALDEIFPPKTKEQWLAITQAFKDFTASLLIADSTGDKIRRTFAGFFAVVDIGWQVLKFLGQAAFEVVKIFLPLTGGFLSASASIGDFLVRLNQVIKSSRVFQYALLAVKVSATLIRNAIQYLISEISDFIRALKDAPNKLDFLEKAGKRIFGGILNSIKMVTDWLSGKFTKAVKTVSGIFDGVFDESAVGIWPTILKVLKEVVEFIGGKASTGFQTFGDVVKNLDFRKIATFVAGGILLLFIKQLSDLTHAMTGFTTAATGILKGFSQKFLSPKSTSLIRDMALALGVLSASLWVLSSIPADDLKKSLIGLAGAIGIFVVAYGLIQGINVAASKLTTNKKMVSSAFGLVGLSTALLVMAVAIKAISKIDDKQVWTATVVLGTMLGFITAYQVLAALISKIPGQQKITANLFGMSASLLGIVGALTLLKLFSINDLQSSLGKMTAILLVLAAIQVLFGVAARIGGGKKASVNILTMAVGITAMLAVMKLLSIISPDTITQGISNLALMTLILAGAEVMMGLASRISGGKKAKSSILQTQVGLLSMVALIAILSLIKQENIDRGITSLAKMAGIITSIEVLTAVASRISGGAKVQKILGSVSVTILSFTGMVALLGVLDQSILDQGMSTLVKMVGLIGAIELITAVSSKISGNAKMFSSLMGVTVAIIALTSSLMLLSMIDQESLRGAATSLAIAAVAILALSFAVEKISIATDIISKGSKGFLAKVKNVGLTLVAIGALLIATTAFFGVLKLVSPIIEQTSWESLGKFAIGVTAITALLVVLDRIPMNDSGFVERLKSLIPGFAGVAAVLLGTLGFFAALKVILPIVDSVSWSSLGKFAVGVTAITALLVVLDRIPMNDSGFVERLKSLIPGFAGVAAVLLGTLGFFAALKVILPIVDSVSWSSLGKFAVGIGIITILIGAIALLRKPLSGLGMSIGPALLGVVAAIAAIAAIVLAFVGLAELLNFMIKNSDTLTRGLDLLVLVGAGIGRFVGAMVGGLAVGALEGIAAGLVGFANALGAFSPDSAIAIKTLAEAILIITGAAVTEGIARFITGKSSMEVFGEQLTTLITALNSISPADAAKASNTLAAMRPMAANLKLFAEAAKGIPNSGGFIGDFMGENDIDVFGMMLAKFVNAFITISIDQTTHMTDVLEAMKPMASNLKLFASVAQKIPNSGGFIGDFMGENDIDVFGVMLAQFVNAFTSVSVDQATHASDVLSSMKGMASNLKLFAEAAQEIPNAGGFMGDFLGTVDLPTFSNQIHGLISTFGTVDQAQLKIAASSLQVMGSKMIPALTKFSELEGGLKSSGGLVQFFSGNTTLSEFGNEFKKFVDKIAQIDSSVVAPAMDALSRVTASFEIIGADVINNAKKSFDNNKEPFQSSIISIFDEPIKELDSQKNKFSTVISSIFKAAVDTGGTYVKDFKELGANLIEGLKSGFTSKKYSAVVSMQSVMDTLTATAKTAVDAHSPSKVFETIGGWCTLGLANGLSKKTDVAVKAGANMAKATEEGIRDTLGVHSISDIFSDIGSYIPASISEGIQNGKDALLGKAEKLGIDTGDLTLEGITSSIAGGESGITTGIKSLLEILTGKNTSDAENTGTGLGDSLTGAFNSALGGLGGSGGTEIVKTELEKLKDLIEERQFYGTITLEEELDLFQELRKSYADGSEERKKIDREIYTRLKTIYGAQLSYIEGVKKAESDAAKKLKDLEEKYVADVTETKADAAEKSKKEETRYYEDLNSILENAEKERQKIREEYADDQKSINDKLLSDIENQNEAYENAVKSRAQSIYGSYNLFDLVGSDADYSGTDLLDNLQSQVNALSEWEQSLRNLANRGVGEGLVEELQNMGPSSKAQINALLTLTDEQLSEYVNLFDQKYSLANEKAKSELTDLKNTTRLNIQDLNSQAAGDLYELETKFTEAMTKIDTNMATDMSKLRTTYTTAMDEINLDLNNKLTELETTWSTESANIQTEQEQALETLKSSYSTTMQDIRGSTEEELRGLVSESKTNLEQLKTDTDAKLTMIEETYNKSASNSVTSFGSTLQDIVPITTSTLDTLKTTVKTSLDGSVADFEDAGLNAANGFANGIRKGIDNVISAAEFIAHEAVSAARVVLDEHSPSAVFEGIGKFVSMGFANGISAYADKAKKASESMANGSIALVAQAFADMDDSDELSPIITPVLDLSSVRSSISSLFNNPVVLGSASSQLAVETVQNGNANATSASVLESLAAKMQQLAQKASASGTTLKPTFVFNVGSIDKTNAQNIVDLVCDEFGTYMTLQGV